MKLSAIVPVSDELIVDAGIGSPQEQAAAAARLEARRQESAARWAALPRRVRIAGTIRARLYEPRHRLHHAAEALRGHDCEP